MKKTWKKMASLFLSVLLNAVYGGYTGDGGRGDNEKWKQGCTDRGEILHKKWIVD